MSHQAPPGADNPPADNAVRRQGRHRRGSSSYLLPLIIAAVVGLSITAAWLTLHPHAPVAAAPATSQVPQDVAESASPASPKPTSAKPAATRPAVTKPSPSPAKSSLAPTPSAVAASPTPPPSTAKPTPAPSMSTPAVSPVDRSVPVVVLNGTDRAGLAVFVRQRLRDLGWDVVRIGNWRSEAVTHTTVFTAGNTNAVRTMWHDLATGDRTQEPLASMSTGTLVIVLAADFHL